ncbi:WD40 repeat domain-containing protein [Geothrix sp. 21YS21S-2]|uniref:WD40 repeat domain-containing protein n=1 Tax=Geothrix sp. 21YS21S-2 TaxID=3068893 RepID=UPI0027B8D710|nr:WD40 repeat domain-containing protein [Geothrix sp. 21YS21S-2]
MPKPKRIPLKLATLPAPRASWESPAPAAPSAPPEVRSFPPTQPVARFFGVPFLKGGAREVTAIHLCPERVHLATIRDGSKLEVSNRLTLSRLELGGLTFARMIAFRPRQGTGTSIELAIVGPPDQPEITRFDVQAGQPLAGLPLQAVTALAYSCDGRFAAAGNRDGKVQVWLLGPGHPTPVLSAGFEAQVESLAFHAEHPTVYATLATGALVQLELAPSPAVDAVQALRHSAPGVLVHRVTTGRRGYSIYLAGRDDQVYVLDTATGEVGLFSPNVGPITGLQILPASGHLCVLGPRSVYLIDPVGPSQQEHLALVCPFDDPIYAAWELDGEAVLVFHAAEGALSA